MSADSSATAAAGAATRVGVDIRRLPWIRPLVGEYAFNFNQVASFYAGDPRSADAWRDAAAHAASRTRDRQALAASLAAQQERRGAPDAARRAAARLADPSAIAVVTGQQAGAFGGPLFTVLKAITAVQLARRAESTLGVPAVPVFWVDAEDHDWDEVASCTVLDAASQPRTVTLPAPDGAGARPIGLLQLGDGVRTAIEEVQDALPRTDFTAWLVEGLARAYRPGAGMAEAFAGWLDALLGPHGLVVFDACDASVKPLLGELFAAEISSGRTAALAAGAGEGLAARGHAPQVVPQPDAVALFRLNGARTPIRRDGDAFAIGEERVDASALAEEARTRPERFSPNVLLRPVSQDTLFPTVCYVAGPSELAYLGQLREVYAHFGVPMPLVHPRATATLVDSATQRFLAKYDVEFASLQPQDEAALNKLLAAQLPASVERALADAEQAIRTAMERVIEALPAVDPTLAGAGRSTLGKMEHELRTLNGKMIQAVKRRDDTLRRQFARAQVQAFPLGQPQERALGVVSFLNLYGPALVERLLQDLPLDIGQHWVLTI